MCLGVHGVLGGSPDLNRQGPQDRQGSDSCTLLDYLDFLIRQLIQLIHQPVDLPVGGIDLALDGSLVVRGLRRS